MSIILPAAKCSQMSNAIKGTGSGGDRCVEATLAMLAVTYKLEAESDPEKVMYAFTEAWNRGSNVSALESGSRIDAFLAEHQIKVSAVAGTFANVQTIIGRGHLAYTGVTDYRKLKLLGGGNPYAWNAANEPGPAGHVLLIVGYGDGVVVHDPLRAEFDGQPAEYSITSFEEAGWDTIVEVEAARLDTPPPPATQQWTIPPGGTFWSAAEHFYGDTSEAAIHFLEAHNPHLQPYALPIGGQMVIPPKPADWASAPVPTAKLFETVATWPAHLATLSGIAQAHGTTVEALLKFPENSKYKKNPDLVHPGDQVRIA